MENQLGRRHRVPIRTGGHCETCQAQDTMWLSHILGHVRTSHRSSTFLIGFKFPECLSQQCFSGS